MACFQPVRVMLDLHKVRVDCGDHISGAAEKCDAHVHGQLLANEKATCMADQQVHRVIYCPPAGVFDGNNPQRIARSENSIEDRFDSGARRQDRALSEPFASKNMRERPFGTKIVYRSHSNLLKPQPIACK